MSIYYDPTLAKLIAWAPRRDLSLRRVELALSQFLAVDVVSDILLPWTVVGHPQFQRGANTDTGSLEWNLVVTAPAMPGESPMMARALVAWASRRPVGPASAVGGGGGG